MNASDDLLVDALVDSQSYRVLAQQAIHALHDLQQRYDRKQLAYQRLVEQMQALAKQVEELRALRERKVA